MSFLKFLGLGQYARLRAGKFSVQVANLLVTDENNQTFVANVHITFNLHRKDVRQARMYFSSVGHTSGTLDYIIKRTVKQWAERQVLRHMRTPPEAEMRRIRGPIAQSCKRYGIEVNRIIVRLSPTVE